MKTLQQLWHVQRYNKSYTGHCIENRNHLNWPHHQKPTQNQLLTVTGIQKWPTTGNLSVSTKWNHSKMWTFPNTIVLHALEREVSYISSSPPSLSSLIMYLICHRSTLWNGKRGLSIGMGGTINKVEQLHQRKKYRRIQGGSHHTVGFLPSIYKIVAPITIKLPLKFEAKFTKICPRV